MSIQDHWQQSQGVEDGDKVRMFAGYNMHNYGASLAFLRTPNEVISKEYTSDYGENMWESG